ncbi:hypothetical protein EVAR_30955_1 [Eumeta japonica]|uniref:Uncharacterized protein n=1 Tax=Eumeta variegata TaxID=151549 RepID=A0A4C1W7C5_EUMVA|nr:hypothetical protein EVAR_30955_1 [Eumeta japonica]
MSKPRSGRGRPRTGGAVVPSDGTAEWNYLVEATSSRGARATWPAYPVGRRGLSRRPVSIPPAPPRPNGFIFEGGGPSAPKLLKFSASRSFSIKPLMWDIAAATFTQPNAHLQRPSERALHTASLLVEAVGEDLSVGEDFSMYQKAHVFDKNKSE